MSRTLPESRLSELSDFVARRTALHFPRNRWDELERKAGSAAEEFGFADPEAFIRWLTSAPVSREQIEVLASHLTVSETYFWREPKVFEALVAEILPELARRRRKDGRRLRLWSAGCATGEEPYSIAIALRRAIPDLDDWRVTLLATDINPRLLRRAAAGTYGEWSFRNAPPWLQESCFLRPQDGRRQILPAIRKLVSFAYLNLADDSYPSPLNDTAAMDIIFCRNVLMYFAPERARRVGQGLYRCLADGGWLMVGACELSQQLFPRFAPVHFPEAIVYRKDPGGARRSPAAAPERASLPRAPEPPPAAPWPAGEPPAAAPVPESAPPPDAYAEALGLYAQGRYADAVRRLEAESTPRSLALAVRALGNQGRLAEALTLCEKVVAADKLEPGLHYLHAAILQEIGREADAARALRRALYLDPAFVPAHFSLGNLALRRGDARTARRSFDNALALLAARAEDEVVPESDGLTAGRLREIVLATARAGALP